MKGYFDWRSFALLAIFFIVANAILASCSPEYGEVGPSKKTGEFTERNSNLDTREFINPDIYRHEMAVYSLDKLEKIILLLHAMIFIIGLLSIGTILYYLRKINERNDNFENEQKNRINEIEKMIKYFEQEQNNNMKEIRKEIDKKLTKMDDFFREFGDIIDKKVNEEVNVQFALTISSKIEQASQDFERELHKFLDKDHLANLENRYLSAEYVYSAIFSQVIIKLSEAMAKGDEAIMQAAWQQLRRGQIAIRQALSANQKDVFAGLGTMREMARIGQVPKMSLWNFICTLKRQNRLDTKNLWLARKIGLEVRMNFEDCVFDNSNK